MGNPWEKRPVIMPQFADGMAFCSCGVLTTGEPFGKCPQWVIFGNGIYWCGIGNGCQDGGEDGDICTPYFRELLFAERIKTALVKMANEGMFEK